MTDHPNPLLAHPKIDTVPKGHAQTDHMHIFGTVLYRLYEAGEDRVWVRVPDDSLHIHPKAFD